MSATYAPTRAARGGKRRSLPALIGGGTLIAALLATLTIALWPASEADKARADGEQLSQAAYDLYYAESTAEVDAALTDINTAVVDSREHAGDAVAEQAANQEDALVRAADGYVGAVTADNEFDQDVYQAELDYAIDDLNNQAAEFRTEAPEVHQAYWEGVEDGFNSGS